MKYLCSVKIKTKHGPFKCLKEYNHLGTHLVNFLGTPKKVHGPTEYAEFEPVKNTKCVAIVKYDPNMKILNDQEILILNLHGQIQQHKMCYDTLSKNHVRLSIEVEEKDRRIAELERILEEYAERLDGN